MTKENDKHRLVLNTVSTPSDLDEPQINNQEFKADGSKLRPSLVLDSMPNALLHVVAVGTYGAEKYEADSWRQVEARRYKDALYRHYLAGDGNDEESGLSHLAHAAWNALVILEFKLNELGNPAPKWNKPPQDHKRK